MITSTRRKSQVIWTQTVLQTLHNQPTAYLLMRCWPLMWTGPEPVRRRNTTGGLISNPPRHTWNQSPFQSNSSSWHAKHLKEQRSETHARHGGRFQRGQHGFDLLTLGVLTFDFHYVQLVFGGRINARLQGVKSGLIIYWQHPVTWTILIPFWTMIN